MSEADEPDGRDPMTGWHWWKGVSGLFYARRPKSSPPIVLRAESLEELREQVRAYLAERARR